MTDHDLDAAMAIVGHRFNDHTLLRLALTHASSVEDRADSNERLEFLGDSVLGLVTSMLIFDSYPELAEGDMTKIKSNIVSRQTCAAIASAMGLDKLIVLGKGMLHQPEIPTSIPAGAFEAVIAAIYLDAGYEAAKNFIEPLIEPIIEESLERGHQENYKSILQQHAQQRIGRTPVYRVLDEQGPDHAKCFKVGIELNGRAFEPAWGQSKKQAEQHAAMNALRELGLLTDGPDGLPRLNEEVRLE